MTFLCIISLHVQDHPIYKLILIANRDEAYARPAESLHWWNDSPHILGGRDSLAKGTWLGITKHGYVAALTNYRNPNERKTQNFSRGDLTRTFLEKEPPVANFLSKVQTNRQQYNGFNLIVGTVDDLYYYSPQTNQQERILAGTHSLSNASLNTPWPKVTKARQQLDEYVRHTKYINKEALFQQLKDEEKASTADLPDTGVGEELEKQLSPIFIRTAQYGTRSSTVLLVTHDNQVDLTERTFKEGKFQYDTHYTFQIQAK
ncbi:MAG TPA: NRDE family protein [Pseudogracilibacillus sp.]|nr:NRDE family protein [Pseudogracilibacillus sp.]